MDTVGDYDAQCVIGGIGIFHDTELKEDVICGESNIGADDKCGIAIAMELYEKHPERFSLLFTVEEESGGGGVQSFIKDHSDLLAKINYCVIADRKGSEDIIGNYNDYCSQEFEDEVAKHLGLYGFSPNHGVRCDADYLSNHINCINVSCGYYNAHSDNEYVVISEFMNTYKAIEYLSEKFNTKMAKCDKTTHKYNSYSMYGSTPSNYTYRDELIEVYGDEVSITADILLYGPDGNQISLKKGDYYIIPKVQEAVEMYGTDIDNDYPSFMSGFFDPTERF